MSAEELIKKLKFEESYEIFIEKLNQKLGAKLRDCYRTKFGKSFYNQSCSLCSFSKICKAYHKWLKKNPGGS